MDVEIELPSFLTAGDEQRFFQGLRDLTAIREFHMNNGRLMLRLTRYQVSLVPLRCLAVTNKKFAWLADRQEYWHQSMFGDSREALEQKVISG